jgi:hypothetical protein
LTHTIKIQNVSAVSVLLNCGADPNMPSRKGITPISVAAHKGNIYIMQMLIDKKVSVNAVNTSGSTALIQVQHNKHLHLISPRSFVLRKREGRKRSIYFTYVLLEARCKLPIYCCHVMLVWQLSYWVGLGPLQTHQTQHIKHMRYSFPFIYLPWFLL